MKFSDVADYSAEKHFNAHRETFLVNDDGSDYEYYRAFISDEDFYDYTNYLNEKIKELEEENEQLKIKLALSGDSTQNVDTITTT